MNITEAAKLLTVAAGFDRRQVTEVTATAWAAVLANYPYPECERAVIEHYRDSKTRGQYLNVSHILDRVESSLRLRTRDIETDVRAAKARGIVPKTWPDNLPLSAEDAGRLQAARDADRETSEQLGIES
ncbi:hypothetical protein [Humibacter sp.]|uniref:hypothetical protein n=1 Tax=Humibacter sp. TaxID=1940291 RepID=UPI003F7D41EB